MTPAETIRLIPEWDYLIITASNHKRAELYERLIDLRKSLGMISGVKTILVVADPGGRRVGPEAARSIACSASSTLSWGLGPWAGRVSI